MKRFYVTVFSLLFLTFLCLSVLAPVQLLNQFEGGFLADYDDVDVVNENKTFGPLIKTELKAKDQQVGGQKNKQGEIVFKLFGFIPIKKVDVVLASDDDYYVGGVPVGLAINTGGAIVIGDENDSVLKEGDIITQINGVEVKNLNQISEVLQNCGEEVEIVYLRKIDQSRRF